GPRLRGLPFLSIGRIRTPVRFPQSVPWAGDDAGARSMLSGDFPGARTAAMSTFYLLPPRPMLGARFADYLETLFPGLDWADNRWTELAEVLGAAASRHPDVYVVYREDLPEGEEPARALADGFGAEAGDQVVEVLPGMGPGGLTTRSWQV